MKTPFSRLRLALLGGLLLAAVPAARADFFTSRTAFNAAAPPLTIQTFENLLGTPQYPGNNPPDNTYYYTNSPLGMAFAGGFRLLGSGDFGTETYLVGPNFPGDGTYSVNGTGSMILGRRYSDFFLPAGVTAFGLDYALDKYWLGPNPVGALVVTATMADGFTQNITVAALGVSLFIGYTAPAGHGGISHFQLNSNGLGLYPYTLVDNMTFNTSAIPEPATWWTGAGLALGLGGIVWRRGGFRRVRAGAARRPGGRRCHPSGRTGSGRSANKPLSSFRLWSAPSLGEAQARETESERSGESCRQLQDFPDKQDWGKGMAKEV